MALCRSVARSLCTSLSLAPLCGRSVTCRLSPGDASTLALVIHSDGVLTNLEISRTSNACSNIYLHVPKFELNELL